MLTVLLRKLREMAGLRPSLFKSLGVGGKLTLSFTALAGITLLVVALATLAGRRATEAIQLTANLREPASHASAQAQANLQRMLLHLHGYLAVSDPQDVAQYQAAKAAFEKNLADLSAMSADWGQGEEAKWLAELRATYGRWEKLPPQLFELHDNPLKNRPALKLARVEVQARRVQILNDIDAIIELQQRRPSSAASRAVIADLLGFQTSFDAVATNLMAYGASGELNFKLTYGPQLATNAAFWNTLWSKRGLFNAEQRERLNAIASNRGEVADLGLQILGILNGEHSLEDLYLYRTQARPDAEIMLGLLQRLTTRQQAELQAELTRARHNLALARVQVLVGGLLAVALSLLLGYLSRRYIVGPVQRLTGVAEQVTGGDLSARARVESGDEIGVLAASINTMTQRLAETIEHLEAAYADARRAQDAAESANRAKSAFLANMSHELRTPLNGILGYAQILRRSKGLEERQVAGLNVIQQSGEHLLTLINDVLDFARIEAGRLELNVNDMRLAKFLRMIVDIIRVRAEQKGLEFIYEAAPDLPAAVRADERRLRQVLLNLLANAVKFTDRGHVRLAVSFTPPEQLCFEVEDTGVGIREDQWGSIFEPFEQVGEMRRRMGGAGLGLAISRQFVRLMGGDIQVRSTVGKGSVFSFALDLPVVALAAESAQVERLVTGYRGPRKSILVVDDVAENRSVVIDMLQPLGFDMAEAGNGRDGLELAQARRPDLILMDNVMPDLNGLEVTRLLRQSPDLAQTPIIAVSASASGADVEQSLAAGASAFLPKPVDLARLLQQIAVLLHLEWTHAAAGKTEAPAEAAPSGPFIAPPPQEMAALLQLARRGNMRDIAQEAERLMCADKRYAAFAAQLRQLAREYQSKAILHLIERHIDGKQVSS